MIGRLCAAWRFPLHSRTSGRAPVWPAPSSGADAEAAGRARLRSSRASAASDRAASHALSSNPAMKSALTKHVAASTCPSAARFPPPLPAQPCTPHHWSERWSSACCVACACIMQEPARLPMPHDSTIKAVCSGPENGQTQSQQALRPAMRRSSAVCCGDWVCRGLLQSA